MKKSDTRVTLFAAIENQQYEALRLISYKEKKSLAQVTREALDVFLKSKIGKYTETTEGEEGKTFHSTAAAV